MKKTSMHLTNKWCSAVLLLFLLSACGGGKSNTTPPSYAPVPVLTPQPPAAPASLTAVQGDGYNTLSWTITSDTLSYNLYWSDTTGVTKATGTKISGVTSPQMHAGITNGTSYYYIVTAVNGVGEGPASNQASAAPANGASLADPLFPNQWHLNNPISAGEDIQVLPVWNTCGSGNTCRGEGIRIAVVDDGLEINHEDLAVNVATGLSYNYVDKTSDPTGGPTDGKHGTSVAGVAAARDLNGLGVRGVAPRANLVGYNYLASSLYSNAADAEMRGTPNVDIYNNSWGPPDGLGVLAASDSLWNSAIAYGLVYGRAGKGSIYVWAGGNGASGSGDCSTCVDNSNHDGFANHRGVIAVCAVGSNGQAASYSEPGANLLLCAPSSDAMMSITTTDRTGSAGFNTTGTPPDYADTNYTNTFSGTSAAAPTVSGVVALMLQANPNLGWRDVRKILADTARVNDPSDPDWAPNGVGYPVNHRYGFGMVDATAAVAAARTWTNLGPELSYTSAFMTTASPNNAIPDNDTTGISSTIKVAGSGINKIETVEVTFSANHPRSGDLEISLTSPMGGESILAKRHDCAGGNIGCSAYNGWVFSSVRQLNESADGNWILTIKDLAPPPTSIFTGTYTGTFQSWRLKIYGRAS